MRVIVALDDHNGMLFNHRRQSSDVAVRNRIKRLISGQMLYMNAYSAEQFKDTDINLFVEEDFLYKAKKGDFCFVENEKLSGVKMDIEEFILFKWNRKYPSDFVLDILPENCDMVCVSVEEFAGHSHDKITMEIWRLK